MGNVTITQLTTGQANVNATEINQLVTPLLSEFNGSIDNTNIKSGANIAWAKIATTGQITNAAISASAAIAGTKISPSFGSQTIQTSGDLTIGGDVAISGTIDFGTDIKFNGVETNATGGLVTTSGEMSIKAWGVIAANGDITASFNVSSVTKGSTGAYTIVWDTDFANANYVLVGTVAETLYVMSTEATGKSAGSCIVSVGDTASNPADKKFTFIAIGAQ